MSNETNETNEIRIVGGYRVKNGRIIDDVERIWFQCNKCKVFDYYHRNEIKCLHCNGYIDGLSLIRAWNNRHNYKTNRPASKFSKVFDFVIGNLVLASVAAIYILLFLICFVPAFIFIWLLLRI